MQHIEVRIGSIPITAKLLLYTLLITGAISSAITSFLGAAINNSSFLDFLMWGLALPLMGIGFIAIILLIAKRWQRIGGVILLGMMLYSLAGVLYQYNKELGLFYDHPYLIAPFLVMIVSWAISGVIIIVRGKSFLVVKKLSRTD